MRTCMGRRPAPYIALIFLDNIFLSFIIVSILMASSSSKSAVAAAPTDSSAAVLIRVDQSGLGDFTTIQAAIDAVPSNNEEYVFIWVKPGVYREKIVVPADKPYITLSGTQATDTIITWNDGESIYESPTVSILASDFVGRYLTFENYYGSRGKGVALRVSGDKAAFYSCRILSFQDTLLDDIGRHYYSNCYIEGATDFICGNAASLFEKCHLHSINEIGYATITAQKRTTPWENTGFIFLGCKITGVGVHTALLGRPWGTYSRVIYAYSFISSTIAPQGWDNWGDVNKESTAFYGEYKCYGAGASREKRVNWSKRLTSEEAAPFLSKDMIGGRGWLRPAPTNFIIGFSNDVALVSEPKE
ncbi:putative pectinesterase 11 [Silene latifolia]|uniref:putative pectinesterase 11 n=1 Tax=Silene latifolia TaxID=37657 RepID=UPI003D786463